MPSVKGTTLTCHALILTRSFRTVFSSGRLALQVVVELLVFNQWAGEDPGPRKFAFVRAAADPPENTREPPEVASQSPVRVRDQAPTVFQTILRGGSTETWV